MRYKLGPKRTNTTVNCMIFTVYINRYGKLIVEININPGIVSKIKLYEAKFIGMDMLGRDPGL